MSFYYDLIDAMRQWDLHINEVNITPGIYHRFRSIGTCKTKCCEYRVFENQLGAHFKCFRRGINRFWFHGDIRSMSWQERQILSIERDRVEKERSRAYFNVAQRCHRFYENLPDTEPAKLFEHTYVKRKRIAPIYSKLARKFLVLPVRNIEHEIQSLQFIYPNGFKKFKACGSVAGHMIWLSEDLPESYNGIIRICEGWSTGCTIAWLTRSPVICALNAGNLLKVAIAVRRKYVHAHGKIYGDNDCFGKENVGLQAATQAASAAGYSLHYPEFKDTGLHPTDFNDLFLLYGKDETLRQLIINR